MQVRPTPARWSPLPRTTRSVAVPPASIAQHFRLRYPHARIPGPWPRSMNACEFLASRSCPPAARAASAARRTAFINAANRKKKMPIAPESIRNAHRTARRGWRRQPARGRRNRALRTPSEGPQGHRFAAPADAVSPARQNPPVNGARRRASNLPVRFKHRGRAPTCIPEGHAAGRPSTGERRHVREENRSRPFPRRRRRGEDRRHRRTAGHHPADADPRHCPSRAPLRRAAVRAPAARAATSRAIRGSTSTGRRHRRPATAAPRSTRSSTASARPSRRA